MNKKTGFTLVEVLIATAVSGILMYVIFALMESQYLGQTMLIASTTKAEIYNSMSASARSQKALAKAATSPLNAGTIVDRCVNRTGACTAGESGEYYFYDRNDVLLAGPTAANVLFDSQGRSCPTHTQSCIFKATASMTAICDGGAATCARAAKLRITFTLEPNLPTLKGEILNGFRKMSGSFVMSAESAALANGNGVPGFVPIWDAGLTLIPSVIEEDFASGDMSIKPQGSPGVVEVYGNAQLGRVPFVPGTTLDVIKTGVFAREIQIGIPGSGIGDLKSRDLASHDPNFSAVFQAGNLTVNTPTGIDANLWTGKVAVSNNVSSLYFISAKSFMVPSDQRLKKDVQKIKNVETLISHLNPVSFKWLGFEDSDIGFIAQDVEAVFPQLVQISENGDKTVRYLSLVAPLGEAIKDFYSKQFQDLQESDRRIQDLENQISK